MKIDTQSDYNYIERRKKLGKTPNDSPTMDTLKTSDINIPTRFWEKFFKNDIIYLMQLQGTKNMQHWMLISGLKSWWKLNAIQFSLVQSLSRVQLFVTPWTVVCQASLSITNSRSLLKHVFIESVMPSSHLMLYRPLFLPPCIFSSIRVFSKESVLHIRWPKYWSFSFSFSMSPSNQYSGLISFQRDWLDLLAVQGTLKSLLQHRSSKTSILGAQLSLWSNSHIH